MKKQSTIISFLFLFLFGCQKEATKQNTSTLANEVTSKENMYVRNDTINHISKKKYSLDTAFLKVHTNSIIGPDPFPIMSLGITYKGNGVYYIQPYNNQGGYNYDCAYQINRENGSNGYSLFFALGENKGNKSAQVFDGSFSAGTYSILVTYFSGPIGNSNGSATEKLDFTIYTEPQAPVGMLCLYRYYDQTNDQHICTYDWEELGSVSVGFQFEKVLAYTYPNSSSAPNLKPIYRYYKSSDGSHFTTDELGNYPGFVYEKILGYVGISQTATLTKPLTKWYDSAVDDHFVCISPDVPAAQGYTQDIDFTFGYGQ